MTSERLSTTDIERLSTTDIDEERPSCVLSVPNNDTSTVGENSAQDSQTQPPEEQNQLIFLSCFKEVRDRQTFLIIISAVLYFMSITMSTIPLTLLINKRIAGHANDPNAKSAFVQATNSFIYSGLGFLCGRYTSGLGDYLGRKPILIMSALAMVGSRVVYIHSHSASGFYFGGLLGGAFDCFYFSSLAWICDVYPEESRRSKRVGLFTGVVGGFAFIIGVPLGAALAQYMYPTFPLQLGMLMGLICIGTLVILPVDDTLGVKSAEMGIPVLGRRMLPADLKAYFFEHFPVSWGTLDLIKDAKYPVDWLINFIGHSNTTLLSLIFVQYALAVFHWSAVAAAGGYLVVGISIAVFGPMLLHRFNPVPLAFRGMIIFTVGLVLLSVAGTGMNHSTYFGIAAIACIAAGTSWVPSLQTNLLSQYGPDVQGAIGGLLGQQKDGSLVPAYIMSLGFTVTLGNDGPVYWPGSTFAVVRTSFHVIYVISFTNI
jgi:MFS family permease